jgi:hypothetical protein
MKPASEPIIQTYRQYQTPVAAGCEYPPSRHFYQKHHAEHGDQCAVQERAQLHARPGIVLLGFVLGLYSLHWSRRSAAPVEISSTTENLAKIKTGSVFEEDKFRKEVEENVATYCTPLTPCIEELQKVVFPEGKRWLKENRQLYSRMKSILQQALDTLEATQQ